MHHSQALKTGCSTCDVGTKQPVCNERQHKHFLCRCEFLRVPRVQNPNKKTVTYTSLIMALQTLLHIRISHKRHWQKKTSLIISNYLCRTKGENTGLLFKGHFCTTYWGNWIFYFGDFNALRHLCFKTRVCLMWTTYFLQCLRGVYFKVTSKRFREEKGLTVRYDSHEMTIKTLVFLTLSNKDLLSPFFFLIAYS